MRWKIPASFPVKRENGQCVPDIQLEFLSVQLQRIKKEKYKGAVLLATHHPPFSYSPAPKGSGSGGNHSSSTDMLREIDTICKTWECTRTPFYPDMPTSQDLILKHYDDRNYGYLRITVDKDNLRIGFQQVGGTSLMQSRADFVTVDLASHTVVGN